jgi:uncharacterized membrane protein YphA (DoxX/SURF4 family)
LLRLAIAVPLGVSAVWPWSPLPATGGLVARLTVLCCGSLVLLGLWTPVVSLAAALAQLGSVLLRHFDSIHLAAALAALSLALLGPGAWSIDARLYGRKRIRV